MRPPTESPWFTTVRQRLPVRNKFMGNQEFKRRLSPKEALSIAENPPWWYTEKEILKVRLKGG